VKERGGKKCRKERGCERKGREGVKRGMGGEEEGRVRVCDRAREERGWRAGGV